MKILLLNPLIDAGHKLLGTLKGRGVSVVVCKDADDAWQQLKSIGDSIDLALIHREGKGGQGEPGVALAAKIKKDKALLDLPIILTSATWGDADFAKHQKTPDGANAYLKFPFTERELDPLVEGVMGSPLQGGGSISEGTSSLVLESSTSLFTRPENGSKSASTRMIKLEAPDLDFLEGRSATEAAVVEVAPVVAEAVAVEAVAVEAVVEVPVALAVETPVEAPATPAPKSGIDSGIDSGIETRFADSSPVSVTMDSSVETRPNSSDVSVSVAQVEGLETSASITSESSVSASTGDGIAISEAPVEFVLEVQSRPEKETTAAEALPPLPALPAFEVADEAEALPTSMDIEVAESAIDANSTTQLPPTPSLEPSFVEASIPTAMTRVESSSESLHVSGEDAQAIEQMPYLFGKSSADKAPSLNFTQPQGDAIIPGGAAVSPDIETMKKYLLLREQDVAALSAQLGTSKEQVHQTEEDLRLERGKVNELSHVVQEQEKRISELERGKSVELDGVQDEIGELKFQVKVKTDKAKLMEGAVREAQTEIERLKDRVRQDIRKIRVREKELENRLEIMKKDSEALIGARENKIMELKRKLDLLEFNMDLLQDQYNREKDNSTKLRERLVKASQVVRVVGGLLDSKGAAQLEELTDGDGTGEAA